MTIKRLLDVLWSYRIARRDRVGYDPYRLWIEPTAICNLQCPHCPNRRLRRRENLGFMDFELFRKVVDEACCWVHDVNLHHRGESLLHPRFFDMVEYTGQRGMYTKLHTNATLLDEARAISVLDSPLDLISFSFDGFDAATYESHRPPATFESTLGNILRFLRLKRERRQRTPTTVVEVLAFADTEGALSREKELEFRRCFDGLPLDKLVVKKPHNWAGNVTLQGGTDGAPFVPCTFPWHGLVVMWDGKVGPCPHDFMGEIVLGDVSKQSLHEIFNSAGIRSLRRRMTAGRLDDDLPCYDCDSVRRQAILGVPVGSLRYLRR